MRNLLYALLLAALLLSAACTQPTPATATSTPQPGPTATPLPTPIPDGTPMSSDVGDYCSLLPGGTADQAITQGLQGISSAAGLDLEGVQFFNKLAESVARCPTQACLFISGAQRFGNAPERSWMAYNYQQAANRAVSCELTAQAIVASLGCVPQSETAQLGRAQPGPVFQQIWQIVGLTEDALLTEQGATNILFSASNGNCNIISTVNTSVYDK